MKVIPSSPVAHFPRFSKLDGVIQHVEGELVHSLVILSQFLNHPFDEKMNYSRLPLTTYHLPPGSTLGLDIVVP